MTSWRHRGQRLHLTPVPLCYDDHGNVAIWDTKALVGHFVRSCLGCSILDVYVAEPSDPTCTKTHAFVTIPDEVHLPTALELLQGSKVVPSGTGGPERAATIEVARAHSRAHSRRRRSPFRRPAQDPANRRWDVDNPSRGTFSVNASTSGASPPRRVASPRRAASPWRAASPRRPLTPRGLSPWPSPAPPMSGLEPALNPGPVGASAQRRACSQGRYRLEQIDAAGNRTTRPSSEADLAAFERPPPARPQGPVEVVGPVEQPPAAFQQAGVPQGVALSMFATVGQSWDGYSRKAVREIDGARLYGPYYLSVKVGDRVIFQGAPKLYQEPGDCYTGTEDITNYVIKGSVPVSGAPRTGWICIVAFIDDNEMYAALAASEPVDIPMCKLSTGEPMQCMIWRPPGGLSSGPCAWKLPTEGLTAGEWASRPRGASYRPGSRRPPRALSPARVDIAEQAGPTPHAAQAFAGGKKAPTRADAEFAAEIHTALRTPPDYAIYTPRTEKDAAGETAACDTEEQVAQAWETQDSLKDDPSAPPRTAEDQLAAEESALEKVRSIAAHVEAQSGRTKDLMRKERALQCSTSLSRASSRTSSAGPAEQLD